jgi:hypothetical protein
MCFESASVAGGSRRRYSNMKTVLEVFYLRIVRNKLCYRRKQMDLSNRRGDPDSLIRSVVQQTVQTTKGVVQNEFVMHSTSWRYVRPGRVVLTYIAYSDHLEFRIDRVRTLTLKQLKDIKIASGRPRTRAGLERQVVAHAMRHIAFLVQTDHTGKYDKAFHPATRKVLKSLWVNLAGRVFPKGG